MSVSENSNVFRLGKLCLNLDRKGARSSKETKLN